MALVLRTRVPRHGTTKLISGSISIRSTVSSNRESRESSWRPRFSCVNDGNNITVRGEIPLHGNRELEITARPGALVVSGVRDPGRETSLYGGRFFWRGSTGFRSEFPLPEGADWKNTRAGRDADVLTVTVPLKAEEEPRHIEVKWSGHGPTPVAIDNAVDGIIG